MQFRELWGFPPKEPINPVVETRADENGEPSPAILPPARDSISVTPRQALKIGTVFRAVSIISTTISQMELEVYRDAKKLKTPLVIQNPIEGESQASFVQQVIWSLALWGNAYVRLYGDPVSSVEVLDPDAVTVTKESGVIRYYIGNVQVPAGRMRHLKFEPIPGELLGYGPLQASTGEVRAAFLLDKFQQTWFDTTGIPKGVLKHPGQMNPEQSKAFITAWNEFVKNNSGTSVLPFGMTYEPINAKPIELQYVDVVNANVRAIARVFGIPANNLLAAIDGTSTTYTNQVESNISFMQNTLSRYMNEIENFLSGLLPRNQRVQFNEEQLMRLAPEKLWTMRKTQYDVGYYDGAEQRKQEGLPPLPKKVEPAGPAGEVKNDLEEKDSENGD